MARNPVTELNRIKHRELDDFFEEQDTGNRRPWDDKEWKEKREQVLAEECQWCEKDAEEAAALQLHHYEEPDFDAEREWIRVEDREFITSDAFDIDAHVQEPSKCPNCTSSNVYVRKTKEPTYRCRRCDYEFPDAEGVRLPDLVAADWPGVYATRAFFDAKLAWVQENTGVVREAFREAYEQHWAEYLSLENTITICRQCHFMHHEHGKRICDLCGDEYGKPRDDFDADYVCWTCVVDEEGLALCPECGDNWYDPARSGACRACRGG